MADPVRIRRIAEQLRAELSRILRDEVRDPRLGLLTVTRVKLAGDLGVATVFYSPLGEEPNAARAQQLRDALARAAGFVRSRLAGSVELRRTPELRFVLDRSIAEGSRMLELIEGLPERAAATADADAGVGEDTGGGRVDQPASRESSGGDER